MAFSAWRTWTTGEVVTAAHMNQEIRDNGEALFPGGVTAVNYQPTLFADGGGVSSSLTEGEQYVIGALQFLWARWNISAIGSGDYYMEAPDDADGIPSGSVMGPAFAQDTSTTANNSVGVIIRGTGSPQQFRFAFDGGNASPTHPFAFTTGDTLSFSAVYPIS